MEKGNDESNKKCAEVVYVKSPSHFWLRFDEWKPEFTEMFEALQHDCKALE
jgi:hypothetical protein